MRYEYDKATGGKNMLGILYDLGIAPDLVSKAIVLDMRNLEKVMKVLVGRLMYDLEYFQRQNLFELSDDELKYYLKRFYHEIVFDRKTDLIMCEVERSMWVIIEDPSDFIFVAKKYYGGVKEFFEYFASDVEDVLDYKNVNIDRYEFPLAVVCDRLSFSLVLEALANYLLSKKGNLEKYLMQFFNEITREAKVDGMICEIDRNRWEFLKSAREFISFIKKIYGSIENFVEEESQGILFYWDVL